MSLSSLVNLSSLIDDAKCYELVRQHRWPEGVRCPHVTARRWRATGMTTRSGIGSAIGAGSARAASMI